MQRVVNRKLGLDVVEKLIGDLFSAYFGKEVSVEIPSAGMEILMFDEEQIKLLPENFGGNVNPSVEFECEKGKWTVAHEEAPIQRVFCVIEIDNQNEDGWLMQVCRTLEDAVKFVRSRIEDKDEEWEQEADFAPGEDPTGRVLKRWHETTQDYYIQIEQRWVE